MLAETLKRELTKVFCEALKPNVEHKLMNNLHE